MPKSIPTAPSFTKSQRMQGCLQKDSDLSTAHSMAPCTVSCPSWWTSAEAETEQSQVLKNLSSKMATCPQHCQNTKQLSFQFQDQDSSSTQSTGESYSGVASLGESNPYGQSIASMQSDYNGTLGKPEDSQTKHVLSMGTHNYVLPPSQVDYSPSFACIPLSYPDPHYHRLFAAYGPQAMIHHPQMMAVGPARVPLPLDLPQDEPIYVNAKQYRAILRRREYRAKLEIRNKLSKVRKPYLHESRHLHALKRARGSGGRFLNKKKLEDSKPTGTTNGQVISGSAQLHSTTRMSESDSHRPENDRNGSTTASCSEITSVSNIDNIFHKQQLRFSAYPSHIGGPMQGDGDGMPGKNHRYLSVLR